MTTHVKSIGHINNYLTGCIFLFNFYLEIILIKNLKNKPIFLLRLYRRVSTKNIYDTRIPLNKQSVTYY